MWDKRPGHYFVEWWEGKSRRRELAGQTPSQVTEAQRRKRNELIGQQIMGGQADGFDSSFRRSGCYPNSGRSQFFTTHIETHSPAKPRTLERYKEVISHFERLLGMKKYVEAIGRVDIDDYKNARSKESKGEGKVVQKVAASTINFEEVTVLCTFFYYLMREREIKMENPCAHFKMLRSATERVKSRPHSDTQEEVNRLLTGGSARSRAMYGTLLLTGLRKEELANFGLG